MDPLHYLLNPSEVVEDPDSVSKVAQSKGHKLTITLLQSEIESISIAIWF